MKWKKLNSPGSVYPNGTSVLHRKFTMLLNSLHTSFPNTKYRNTRGVKREKIVETIINHSIFFRFIIFSFSFFPRFGWKVCAWECIVSNSCSGWFINHITRKKVDPDSLLLNIKGSIRHIFGSARKHEKEVLGEKKRLPSSTSKQVKFSKSFQSTFRYLLSTVDVDPDTWCFKGRFFRFEIVNKDVKLSADVW